MLMEPSIFEEIKNQKHLSDRLGFNEHLQVLLIGYLNLAIA
jgi:hypothetical protein